MADKGFKSNKEAKKPKAAKKAKGSCQSGKSSSGCCCS